MNLTIYVSNLGYTTTSESLKELFAGYGETASANIITDKFNGRSEGFGFVARENTDEAKNAIEDLNGPAFEDR